MRSIFIVLIVILLLAIMGCGLSVLVAAWVVLCGLAITIFIWQQKITKGEIKFLAFCRNCHVAIPVFWTNRTPEFTGNSDETTQKNDFEVFSRLHAEHALGRLSVVLDPWRKGVPYDKQTKEEILIAREDDVYKIPFLVRRERIGSEGGVDIMSPLRYQAFPAWHWRAHVFLLRWALESIFRMWVDVWTEFWESFK